MVTQGHVMDTTRPPGPDEPLLHPCTPESADILWRGESYQLCGHKALVLVREYWAWTRELADEQRPHMIRNALKEAQTGQKKRLTREERADIVRRVEERIAASMTAERVPVRTRHVYNLLTDTRQPEGWDQLEQRVRDRWGALWAESMTWPNPLWEKKEIDWRWLDMLTGKTETGGPLGPAQPLLL